MDFKELNFVVEPCDKKDADYLESRIDEYDDSRKPEGADGEEEEFCYKAVDGEGNILAGSVLQIDKWKTADLDILWVDERYRRRGLGSALIRNAERVFREKGCDCVHLGTFDFQARPLYEKHGYTVVGTVENWPRGHCNYHLTKRLDQPCREYVPSKPQPEMRYEIVPGSKEDRDYILKGLEAYNDSQVADLREEEPLGKKILDADGNLIAGSSASVGTWNEGFVDLWVEEPYRGRGIGTWLLGEFEREAREKGAYAAVIGTFDWQVEFFRKRGYAVVRVQENPAGGYSDYLMIKEF